MIPIDTILQGDAARVLSTLPDESIDCCITSPPYWSLRNYNVEGQIGLEDTPDEYVAKLVEVFDQVRRVLKGPGTLWLNLGDCYAGSWGNYSPKSSAPLEGWTESRFDRRAYDDRTWRPPNSHRQPGLKTKDLVGLPWMVAFALRSRGWYLRSDIIWAKPNPMPESVQDRPTKSHEYVFLLSKSERYYYDIDAIREEAAYDGRKDTRMKGSIKYSSQENVPINTLHIKGAERWPHEIDGAPARNKRSVWTVNTKPFSEAHFATFPEELIEPMIKAGCPDNGIVLDPFFGAGTTGLVARKLLRHYIGIELNPAYIQIAEKRLGKIPARLDSFCQVSP